MTSPEDAPSAQDQDLQSFQERLALALSAANMGIWDLDLRTQQLVWDDATIALFGFDRASFPGVAAAAEAALHPDDLKRLLAERQRAISTRTPFRCEYRVNLPGGGIRWILSMGRASYDDRGQAFRMSGVVMDITERKRSEQALVDSERQFRHLADSIVQMVWVTDLSGAIQYINQRWYDYTGVAPGSLDRSAWISTLHPDELQQVVEIHAEALRNQAPFEVEYRVRRHDGVYRWHLARTVFVRDAEGKIARRFGSATDIHEQKLSEERQREFASKLEAAVRSRDEFLSIASHELKTPLTGLKLQLQMRELLLDKGRLDAFEPDKLRKMLQVDSRQVDRIGRLIDDMLDISRINTGRLSIQPEPMDLGEMARDVTERLGESLKAAGCEVEIEIEPGNTANGNWDRFRLEQAYINLLTNSMRYGAGKPIHVRVSTEGGKAVLSVVDQGAGIAPENHGRIFERFERFERAVSSDEVSGLGLGLFITREIVEAHGGAITVESSLGRGAVFRVELPIGGA